MNKLFKNKKKAVKNNYTLGIYVVYDKVSEQIRTVTLAENDRAAISNIVLSGIGNRFPYRDLEVREIGYIESSTCKAKEYDCFIVIPWNIYSAPVTERENLATLGDEVLKAYDEATKTEENKDKMEVENDTNNTEKESNKKGM